MSGKYGIVGDITGVYLITCKHNNKRYVGSSVDITRRFSNHMNRDAKLYPHRDFYKDVNKYTYTGFTFEILEVCERDELIEREQYYYDKLQPEYNEFRPSDNLFIEPEYRDYLVDSLNRQKEKLGEQRRELFSQPKYKRKFRELQRHRMRAVNMYTLDGSLVSSFECMSDCAKWLDKNTKYIGKNKVSKIKAVCDGERKTAYGYYYEYK